MYVGNVPQANRLQNAYLQYSKTSVELTVNSGKEGEQAFNLSIHKETIDFSATYSNPAKNTNQKNDALQNAEEKNEISTTAQTKKQIQDDILEQTRSLLAEFFNKNPEAANEVSQGKIPDYFNEENTARRILNLWIPHYDGADPKAAAEEMKSYIKQAYDEVSDMNGGLPDIVQNTRQLIMDLLDRYAQGEDLQSFLNGGSLSEKEAA